MERQSQAYWCEAWHVGTKSNQRDMREKLKKSGVVFDEESHTYTLKGKQLRGITEMIKRQLFGEMYADVPEFALEKACQRGKAFHKDMEAWATLGIDGETEQFEVFKEKYADGFEVAASEYIVTDGKNWASPIDAVTEDGFLIDYKTSSGKDMEYWRWQLSIYRYLFKLQNGIFPKGLKVLWINNEKKNEMIDIEPIDEETIKELLKAEEEGRQFVNPLALAKDPSDKEREQMEALQKVEELIIGVQQRLEELKEAEAEMARRLLSAMKGKGVTKWIGNQGLEVSIRAAYERRSVDSKKLKEAYPKVYADVEKVSKIGESLQIKVKKQ